MVASVSCIYGLVRQKNTGTSVILVAGDEQDQDAMLKKLVQMQYGRNDLELFEKVPCTRRCSRYFPAAYYSRSRWSFGDEIDSLLEFDTITGEVIRTRRQ